MKYNFARSISTSNHLVYSLTISSIVRQLRITLCVVRVRHSRQRLTETRVIVGLQGENQRQRGDRGPRISLLSEELVKEF